MLRHKNKSRRSCRAVWPSAGFGDQEDDYEKVGMLSPESKTRRFSGHCSAASLKRDCALVRPALRSRQRAPTEKSTQNTFRCLPCHETGSILLKDRTSTRLKSSH